MGGLRTKPGLSGIATYYISRNAALKRLQLSLKTFRTLCILKGIYPKEPRNMKGKTKNRVYYYLKDIQYMQHDPLIHIYREQKVFRDKIKHYKVKEDPNKVMSLMLQFPVASIDHIIKERYPTFIDALRELNDALSLIYLFSRLPAKFGNAKQLTSPRIDKWSRLCREWENYVIKTSSLQKVFVSIKGYYFQAKVHDEEITWMAPHQFSLSQEEGRIDIWTMVTFMQLWENLLGFIFYRLYHDIGEKYPPVLRASVLDNLLADVEAKAVPKSEGPKRVITKAEKEALKRVQSLDTSKLIALDKQAQNESMEVAEEDDDEFAKQLAESEKNQEKSKQLFSGLKIFISRECPRGPLEFVIKALGGEVAYEEPGASFGESDDGITHQIVDRDFQRHTHLGRSYVQPQWVFDCANERILLPTVEYGPTANLPPHLSPFVKDQEVGYVPSRREKLEKIKQALETGRAPEEAVEEDEDALPDENAPDAPDDIIQEYEETKKGEAEDEEEEEELDEEQANQKELELEYEAQLKAEQGKEVGAKKSVKRKQVNPEQEEKERSKMMLTRKNRSRYNKLKREETKKVKVNDALVQKRKQIDEQERSKKKKKVAFSQQ